MMSQHLFRLKSLACSLSVFLIVTGIPACRKPPTPAEETILFKGLEQGRWHAEENLDYELFVPCKGNTYRIELILRTDNRYPKGYINIASSLQRDLYYNRKDTLRLTLASEAGKWIGKGVAVSELRTVLYHSISPPLAGIYKLSVKPAGDSTLYGVQTVGIRMLCTYNTAGKAKKPR